MRASGRSTVRPKGLIDANAIVAIVDAGDVWHRRCREALNATPIPLATSAAALAEVFHLLAAHEVESAWKFLASGIVTLLPRNRPTPIAPPMAIMVSCLWPRRR